MYFPLTTTFVSLNCRNTSSHDICDGSLSGPRTKKYCQDNIKMTWELANMRLVTLNYAKTTPSMIF